MTNACYFVIPMLILATYHDEFHQAQIYKTSQVQ